VDDDDDDATSEKHVVIEKVQPEKPKPSHVSFTSLSVLARPFKK
jgi:hypothetical protein